MKNVNILLLQFEHVLEYRTRAFVWFLNSITSPFIILLFWFAAFKTNPHLTAEWTLSTLTAYYFIVALASTFLKSHIEEDVGEYDIKLGDLTKYLMRPFPYFWIKFLEEIPYRILQGAYGVMAYLILAVFFGLLFSYALNIEIIILTTVIVFLGFFLSFTYKMILGLMAFWLTDIHGLFNLMEIIFIIFAGSLLPLDLLPPSFEHMASLLPFSSMLYYPVLSLQGKLSFLQLTQVLSTQILWLSILGIIYHILWNRGIRKFTAVGQ